MTRSWLRPLVIVALCALAAGPMSGCESPADPPTTDCSRITVFNGPRQIPGTTQVVQRITSPATGRIRFTVDWVSPDSIIRVVLTQAPCGPEQFRVNGCNVIADVFPPPKPVEEATTWLQPGEYDLILANFTAADETASVDVVLSTTGCSTP
jgi:hypothetical protein